MYPNQVFLITVLYAHAIYDILVRECHASSEWREDFVWSVTTEESKEYRFNGVFGFGGKFWNSGGRWYVNYYQENETPERQETMKKTNELFAELRMLAQQEFIENG